MATGNSSTGAESAAEDSAGPDSAGTATAGAASASAEAPDSQDALGPDFDPALPTVLIGHLGSPKEPTAAAVRPFLREFLSDRRVIEMPPAVWQPILRGIVLRTRPANSADLYRQIWDAAGPGTGSPLIYWAEAQRAALAEKFAGTANIVTAFCYTAPRIGAVLEAIYQAGGRQVFVLPPYPQYSASSSAPVTDRVARWMLSARDQMEIRTNRSFPTTELYISALANAIESLWEECGRPNFAAGERLLLSFHSIPEEMREAGDPYVSECQATASALATRLGLAPRDMLVTYQSVFGPAQWVGPATIDTVKELGARGVSRLDVVCPGFLTDCFETVQEINILNRLAFQGLGGGDFFYIPWANNSPGCVEMLAAQIRRGIAGW
ncbi:ferrochelatase [Actinobaculum suis]|uniref:ferrochelatase n=1 Tax=Actinobaculum suis TaxID=1657 RepID=UPI0009E2A1DD|nr:ferrochelatase [Actinobaculum suis]